MRNILVFYDPWPELNNAERENLTRLEISCNNIGILFYTIDCNNLIVHPSNYKNINIVVFEQYIIAIIYLHHFQLPMPTRIPSLYALWNPLDYLNKSDMIQILNFDYFLSCHSNVDIFAKDNGKYIIGYLNHSLPETLLLNPSFGEHKCFYVGINWELLDNDEFFHVRKNIMELCKYLTNKKVINIYGPKIFHGIEPWKGYASYVGEIPFDGITIIKEINKCGICLVLSSDSHKQYGICTNRLFEGIAAGVPLICDENTFIKKFFGDNVFYIDLSNDKSIEQECQKIITYIEYIKNNGDKILNMIENCRKIFLKYFNLDNQLQNIINTIRT